MEFKLSIAKIISGDLEIRLTERSVYVCGQRCKLTRLEFELLVYLVRNSHKVLEYAEILRKVWNYPENTSSRTLATHMGNLRRKLGSMGRNIQTYHSVGYRFCEASTSSE